MSIDQLKRFLREHTPNKYSCDQLSNYIGLNIYSVYTNVRKLRKEINAGQAKGFYFEWETKVKNRPYRIYYFKKE